MVFDMLRKLILTLAFATVGDSLGLCDTLIEELGENSSTSFCYWLTETDALSPFNNETSDITVLAFNDTGYTSSSTTTAADVATLVQYYMVKGVHEAKSFPNISDGDVEYGDWRYALLDTFLDDGAYANRSGGAKILAQANIYGELEFNSGGLDSATALKTVSFLGEGDFLNLY